MNLDNIRIFVRIFKPHRAKAMSFIHIAVSCMACIKWDKLEWLSLSFY